MMSVLLPLREKVVAGGDRMRGRVTDAHTPHPTPVRGPPSPARGEGRSNISVIERRGAFANGDKTIL